MMLRSLVVLYETEAGCRMRLEKLGVAAKVASEIAFYLRQATDFEALAQTLVAALHEAGVELHHAGLDERHRWLPWLTGSDAPSTLLWCLTDGFAWYRGSFVSSLAGLLGVPQFGSPPAAQHLCQDKFRSLTLARAIGLSVPPTVLVENLELLSSADVLPAGVELFVKPNTLGAKLGISEASRTTSLDGALKLCGAVWRRYRDRALIQPYISGADVRVSFMDLSERTEPLGVYAVRAHRRGFPILEDSLRVTAMRAGDGRTLVVENLAGTAVARMIASDALRLARALDLRDYWSMDFRLADNRTAWFLEFEVCPAVTIYDFLTYLHDAYGLGLPEAIARAAPIAFRRRLAPQESILPASLSITHIHPAGISH